MAEMIAGWTFGGVWLSTALWAVLDAESRRRNPIVWGLLTFFLGPFALGAYAITGGGDESASGSSRRRTYYFTAAFFFLGLSYASLVALLGVALDAGVSRNPIDSEDARTATAILLAVLVFAVPLWTFHWVQALGLLEQTGADSEVHALFLLARRYGAVVLVISGLITIGFGIYLVFTLFATILDVFEGGRDEFLPVITFLPLTILLMAYHWLGIFGSSRYRALASRFENSTETTAGRSQIDQPAAP